MSRHSAAVNTTVAAGDLTAADLGRRVIIREPNGTVTGAFAPLRLVNVRHYLETYDLRRGVREERISVWVLVERIGTSLRHDIRHNIPLNVDSEVEFVAESDEPDDVWRQVHVHCPLCSGRLS